MAGRRLALFGALLVAGCGSRTPLDAGAPAGGGGGSAGSGGGGTSGSGGDGGATPVPSLEPAELVYFDSDETDYRLFQIAVAAAPDDGVFVAGGNPAPVTVQGRRLDAGAFLTAFDGSAELRWAAPLVSAGGGSRIAGVVALGDGSVVVGGYFTDRVDFGGVVYAPRDEDGDGFVARYAADGSLRWVRAPASPGGDRGVTLELASGDRVYAGGYLGGLLELPTGSLDASDHDAFLLELDAAGEPVRAELLRCDGLYSSLLGVAREPSGDVLIAGYAAGTIHVGGEAIGDPGTAFQGFWARFDAQFVARQAEPLPIRLARAVEAGESGAFLAGELAGSATIAGMELTAGAEGAPLIARLDRTGTPVWATLVSSAGSIYDLALDRRGRLYAAGSNWAEDGAREPYLAVYDERGTQAELLQWAERRAALTSLALTPGGQLWAAGYYENSLSLGREPHEVPAPSGFLLHFPAD